MPDEIISSLMQSQFYDQLNEILIEMNENEDIKF